LRNIAKRVALLTQTLANAIEERGFEVVNEYFFDTIVIKVDTISGFREKAERQQLNFRYFDRATYWYLS
jgi:glycine dehydrogenase